MNSPRGIRRSRTYARIRTHSYVRANRIKYDMCVLCDTQYNNNDPATIKIITILYTFRDHCGSCVKRRRRDVALINIRFFHLSRVYRLKFIAIDASFRKIEQTRRAYHQRVRLPIYSTTLSHGLRPVKIYFDESFCTNL